VCVCVCCVRTCMGGYRSCESLRLRLGIRLGAFPKTYALGVYFVCLFHGHLHHATGDHRRRDAAGQKGPDHGDMSPNYGV
jgi:hypothetical protein